MREEKSRRKRFPGRVNGRMVGRWRCSLTSSHFPRSSSSRLGVIPVAGGVNSTSTANRTDTTTTGPRRPQPLQVLDAKRLAVSSHQLRSSSYLQPDARRLATANIASHEMEMLVMLAVAAPTNGLFAKGAGSVTINISFIHD